MKRGAHGTAGTLDPKVSGLQRFDPEIQVKVNTKDSKEPNTTYRKSLSFTTNPEKGI